MKDERNVLRGKILRLRREVVYISPEEIAEQSYRLLCERTILAWERGEWAPRSRKKYRALCELLGTSVHEVEAKIEELLANSEASPYVGVTIPSP